MSEPGAFTGVRFFLFAEIRFLAEAASATPSIHVRKSLFGLHGLPGFYPEPENYPERSHLIQVEGNFRGGAGTPAKAH